MTNEEMILQIKNGNKQLIYDLWQQNGGLIYRILKKYTNCDCLEDLQQTAFIGFMNAITTYDQDKGLFSTWFPYHVHKEIQQYIYNNQQIKIPVYMQNLIIKYKKFKENYYLEHGEKPTKKELLQKLEINPLQLEEIEKTINQLNTVSLDEPLPDQDGEEITQGDCIASDQNIENDLVDWAYSQDIKKIWGIVEELEPKTAAVMTGIYKKNQSYKEISQQLGISNSQISRLKANGLLSLHRSKKLRWLLEDYEQLQIMTYKSTLSRLQVTFSSTIETQAIKQIEIEEKMKKYL